MFDLRTILKSIDRRRNTKRGDDKSSFLTVLANVRDESAQPNVNLSRLWRFFRKGGHWHQGARQTLPIRETVCARADGLGLGFGTRGGHPPTRSLAMSCL